MEILKSMITDLGKLWSVHSAVDYDKNALSLSDNKITQRVFWIYKKSPTYERQLKL